MSEGYIQVPTDSSGKRVRTDENTIGGTVVQTEVVKLSNTSNTLINPGTEEKQDDIITQQIDGTQQTKIKETIPTDATKNNGSFVYTYDGSGNLAQIDQTIGAVTYRKILTYDGSNTLIAMSSWTVV